MKINVLTEFKSHDLWCHPGEVRVVSDDLGAYFVKQGWAKEYGSAEPAAEPDTTDKTLDVQNGVHKSAASSPQ